MSLLEAEAAIHITSEEMEIYRATARRRAEEHRQRMEARREKGWEFARRAAALLKEQFAATRVVAFGSLVRGGLLHERSDIDLAEWGIDEKKYLRACSAISSLGGEFEVDLVEAEFARPSILAAIEREGVEL